MVTATEEQILILAQWFSPSYPVGAFAYSHGLEWAIGQGEVDGSETLREWITEVVKHGAGRCDALFLAAAYRAANETALLEIDGMCRSFAPSAERLKETDLQGAAFCAVTSAVWPFDLSGLTYPVSVGCAARLASLPPILTAKMFLQAFVGNLVGVGMRIVPIGQTEGQRLIRHLMPLCQEIAEATQAGDLDDLSSTAFLADIASMKHETQYSRVFRT